MIRNWLCGFGLAAAVAFAGGCDQAKDAAKKAEEGAKKAEDKAKDAAKDAKEAAKDAKASATEAAEKVAAEAKTAVIDPIKAELPKLEEKVKALSGDALVKAKEKFDAVKKLVEEFTNAPADKYKDIGEKLKAAFEELKKLVA